MSFKEKFHPKIKHDLKALDKSVIQSIKTVHLDEVLNNPYDNDKLKGKLSKKIIFDTYQWYGITLWIWY